MSRLWGVYYGRYRWNILPIGDLAIYCPVHPCKVPSDRYTTNIILEYLGLTMIDQGQLEHLVGEC